MSHWWGGNPHSPEPPGHFPEDVEPEHPTIHTYLVYCFGCKQEYEQGRGKHDAEPQRPTACGLCGSREIGTFKKIMPDPDATPPTAMCDVCGHSAEDHHSDEGYGQCHNGSGNGNTCPCGQYTPLEG